MSLRRRTPRLKSTSEHEIHATALIGTFRPAANSGMLRNAKEVKDVIVKVTWPDLGPEKFYDDDMDEWPSSICKEHGAMTWTMELFQDTRVHFLTATWTSDANQCDIPLPNLADWKDEQLAQNLNIVMFFDTTKIETLALAREKITTVQEGVVKELLRDCTTFVGDEFVNSVPTFSDPHKTIIYLIKNVPQDAIWQMFKAIDSSPWPVWKDQVDHKFGHWSLLHTVKGWIDQRLREETVVNVTRPYNHWEDGPGPDKEFDDSNLNVHADQKWAIDVFLKDQKTYLLGATFKINLDLLSFENIFTLNDGTLLRQFTLRDVQTGITKASMISARKHIVDMQEEEVQRLLNQCSAFLPGKYVENKLFTHFLAETLLVPNDPHQSLLNMSHQIPTDTLWSYHPHATSTSFSFENNVRQRFGYWALLHLLKHWIDTQIKSLP